MKNIPENLQLSITLDIKHYILDSMVENYVWL